MTNSLMTSKLTGVGPKNPKAFSAASTVVFRGLAITIAVLSSTTAWAQVPLPAAPTTITFPNPTSPNVPAFSTVLATFGPSDGLLYVWDGVNVLKESAPGTSQFNPFGSVPSTNSSDPGPITFSSDGNQILLGNGAGGNLGGTFNGMMYIMPKTGGAVASPVGGSTLWHDAFVASSLSSSQYFVNQGNASFSGSSVSRYDATADIVKSVIQNIPGAGASMAVGNGRLFVDIGFGPQRGEIRSFALTQLNTAASNNSPLDWTTGTIFNSQDNNSGAGMFFDQRGLLFVGGGDGVTVFDTLGHSRLYSNNGYSVVTYDSHDNAVLVTGFGDHQGIYLASMFAVPEPSTALLALLGLLSLPLRRRMRRR